MATKHGQLMQSGVIAARAATFKYAQLEAAIAKLHDVPPGAMKTFRSRLRNFQRIGIVPSSPGKGQKLDYRLRDAIIWAICFELAEFGLPPDQIKFFIQFFGKTIVSWFEQRVSTEEWFLVLSCNFLEQRLKSEVLEAEESILTVAPLLPRSLAIMPASEMFETIFKTESGVFPRALIVNLTRVKRGLGEALKIEWA